MFLIHVLGQVPDLAKIQAFCARHGLELLEDACESLGAHFGGKHVGNFASMGSFSCYFSHHISTIEGGVILTSDAALHDDLRSLRAHGWVRDRADKARWVERHPELDPRFMFITGGYNVRPMEMQGAIGRVQLARLDHMLDAREALAREVHRRITRAAPWLELIGASRLSSEGPPSGRRARTHSWMTLPMRVAPGAPLNVAGVKAHLEKMGVETRPIIAGNLARHPGVAQFTTRSAPSLRRADELLENAFMIGCHPLSLSDDGSIETLWRALDSLAHVES
jgi:CDP-6-deoxy-D-xylo-4-hexulose-3-dehydrase